MYHTHMLEKGLVQIYTGKGKGKTTAAIGLAIRAAGQGNKVLFYQFLKPPSMKTGEREIFQAFLLNIKISALDFDWNMALSPKSTIARADAKKLIKKALEDITKQAKKKEYDLIILDELVYCLSEKLADLADIKKLIQKRHANVEIIMTGRGATDKLMSLADLVTEMKMIKHPFEKGINARKGIEF